MAYKKIIIAVAKEKISQADYLGILRCKEAVENVFLKKGIPVETLHVQKKDFVDSKSIKKKILTYKNCCIFNLFEGFCSDCAKEIEFVKILENNNITFTGNGSAALGNCLGKQQAKNILKKHGLLAPGGIILTNPNQKIPDNLAFPLFIKPAFEDASLGIDEQSLVKTKSELSRSLARKIKDFPRGLLVEEFISGKEYSIGLIGSFPYEVLAVSVLDYSKYKKFSPFLTYASKWDTVTSEFKQMWPSLDAKINPAFKKKIIKIARQAGKVLGCRGYFRVDLREKNKRIFILDINPNPDISPDSGFVRQAAFKGYNYQEIITKIAELA